jgi:hypothetical protein
MLATTRKMEAACWSHPAMVAHSIRRQAAAFVILTIIPKMAGANAKTIAAKAGISALKTSGAFATLVTRHTEVTV